MPLPLWEFSLFDPHGCLVVDCVRFMPLPTTFCCLSRWRRLTRPKCWFLLYLEPLPLSYWALLRRPSPSISLLLRNSSCRHFENSLVPGPNMLAYRVHQATLLISTSWPTASLNFVVTIGDCNTIYRGGAIGRQTGIHPPSGNLAPPVGEKLPIYRGIVTLQCCRERGSRRESQSWNKY